MSSSFSQSNSDSVVLVHDLHAFKCQCHTSAFSQSMHNSVLPMHELHRHAIAPDNVKE